MAMLTEVRADQLRQHQRFTQDPDDPAQKIDLIFFHGDSVLVTTDDLSEITLDRDEVVFVVTIDDQACVKANEHLSTTRHTPDECSAQPPEPQTLYVVEVRFEIRKDNAEEAYEHISKMLQKAWTDDDMTDDPWHYEMLEDCVSEATRDPKKD